MMGRKLYRREVEVRISTARFLDFSAYRVKSFTGCYGGGGHETIDVRVMLMFYLCSHRHKI